MVNTLSTYIFAFSKFIPIKKQMKPREPGHPTDLSQLLSFALGFVVVPFGFEFAYMQICSGLGWANTQPAQVAPYLKVMHYIFIHYIYTLYLNNNLGK